MSLSLSSFARSRRAASLLAALLTVVAGLGLVTAGAEPASAASSSAQFAADVNAARAAHGLPPLAWASDVAGVAADWARRMAAAGDISHNPALETAIHDWRAVGENVGMGPDEASIHAAFMSSAPHRANILDHDYTQIGVGTAIGSDGTLYVVEDFRQPMTASPAHTASPAPTGSANRAPSHAGSSPAATARRPAPQPATEQPATTRPAPPRLTPAQRLAKRLAAARAAAARHRATDPLARAVGFAHTMAALSG